MSEFGPETHESKRYATLSGLRLENWKSIENADVSFKPLTLLVGQNSVGKSSFFQALLSLAQWAATGSKADFPLNGDIVRLGKFSDTLTKIINSSERNPTSISMEIRIGENAVLLGLVPGAKLSSALIQRFEATFVTSNLSLIQGAEGLELMFKFHPQEVDTSYGMEWDAWFSLEFENLSRDLFLDGLPKDMSILKGFGTLGWSGMQNLHEVVVDKLRIISFAMTLAAQRYKEKPKVVPISSYLAKVLNNAQTSSTLVSAEEFVRLLDDEIHEIVQFVDVSPRESNNMLYRSSIELAFESNRFAQFVFPDLPFNAIDLKSLNVEEVSLFSPAMLEEIENFVKQAIFYDESGGGGPIEVDDEGELLFPVRENPQVMVSESFRALPFFNSIAWHGDGVDYPTSIRTPQSVLEDDLEKISSDISSKISYIGPLRVNGYSSALLGSFRNPVFPVGESGEFTPLLISELLSEVDERDFPVFGQGIKKCTFREALESWFGQFTIPGVPLQIVDLDKQGIQVQVASRSLDRFGTGASQVLPILALVLSRRPGDVVLIEQPELHLHPGGQQYLADLFMAASSMGIQLVLETHSEYIVNRIRRGIVLEFIESENVQIVNFEQDSRGLAEVTCVNLTESGGFADWPRGFFANTEDDLLDIIRALEARDS